MELVLVDCGLGVQVMIPGAMEFVRHGLNLMGAWFIIPITMECSVMEFSGAVTLIHHGRRLMYQVKTHICLRGQRNAVHITCLVNRF